MARDFIPTLTPRQQDVQAAYCNGRSVGRDEGIRETEHRTPMGISIGIPIGVLIVVAVQWWFS